MKLPADLRYTEEMLREAMELLEDNTRYMGLFQRQRYGKLKKRFDQHEAIQAELKKALNGIDVC